MTSDARDGGGLLRVGLVITLVVTGLHAAWLLLHPGGHTLVVVVDNIAQGLDPLLLLLGVLLVGARARARGPGRTHRSVAPPLPRPAATRRWAPRLLALGVLAWVVGQALWTYYENVIHQPPFPSWADAGYLSIFPFLLGGILLLPARPLLGAARLRLTLDGLIVMAGIVTVSWYFVLGPTVLLGGNSLIAKAVSAAYPLCDLALLCCMLLLAVRTGQQITRGAVAVLTVALALIVMADSIFTYQQLHNAYATGELLDVLWPLGYMLVALVAGIVRADAAGRHVPRDEAQSAADAARPPRLWSALAPYAVLPVVGVLAASAWGHPGDPHLDAGVFLGAAVLVVLIVLRQVVAMRETIAYAERLHALSTNNAALSAANTQLEIMATTDALTGLVNRTLLRDRLSQALRETARAHTSIALLLLDLDHFKEVNDTLGHQVGDVLLQEVATRLRAALRTSDTVARLGGDEFAVLLPRTDEAGAIRVARALLAAVERPILVEGQTLAVEGSVGVALAAGGADASALLRQADVAMYLAKRARSGYALYDRAADVHNPARLVLMSALRQALADDVLVLHYQPQVALASGRPCAVEALLRWPHPERGFIPPDEFIPLAEQTGLIAPLTRWVLATALRQAQVWREEGLSVTLSVNLSARTVQDPTLPALVANLLGQCAVAPDLLTLEITESALMIDPLHARDTLARLHDLGVQLSIDDFGTGYSSLGYLKELPVDEVKIDKSFLRGLGDTADLKDAAIVRAVIAMAQALDLRVVAEGVETSAAWERLRALGCTLAQGYYLSRPLPASELTTWLRSAPGRAAATAGGVPLVSARQQR